jgi:hypothetical protein
VKVLYGLSITFGVAAILCGVVFLFSPKQGIAVVMFYSMLGGIGAACASFLFGVAGFIASIWKSPRD